MEPHPDVVRVARALGGDAVATSELVATLAPVIQRQVARILLCTKGRAGRDVRPEVEDLTQEVLLALFEGRGKPLRSWSPERCTLEQFVAVVAKHKAYSKLRSQRQSPYRLSPVDGETLDASPDLAGRTQDRVAESREALTQLLDEFRQRLSAQGFEMFRSLFVLEESPEEICQKTGYSLDAVYQWRSRLRKLALTIQADRETLPALQEVSHG